MEVAEKVGLLVFEKMALDGVRRRLAAKKCNSRAQKERGWRMLIVQHFKEDLCLTEAH